MATCIFVRKSEFEWIWILNAFLSILVFHFDFETTTPHDYGFGCIEMAWDGLRKRRLCDFDLGYAICTWLYNYTFNFKFTTL